MREAGSGFREPDEFRELRKGHVGANLAVGVEQRFGGKAAELETAAETFNTFTPSPFGRGVRGEGAFGVAAGDALDALGGHVFGNICVHLDEDETAVAAILGILLEYGVGGSAGACKAVED